MANVYAVKSGNWSDTTVWNTSSLPDIIDDVYANTYTIYVDGNYQVSSVRNLSATSITRGGSFILNDGVSLSANVIGGGSDGVFCVRFLSADSSFSTIVGNISADGQLSNVRQSFALELSGTGTLNVYGNAVGAINNSSGTGVSDGYIQINAPGVLNIYGDVRGSDIGNVYFGINNKTNGVVNILGNVTGRTVTGGGVSLFVINNTSTGTINITGNVAAGAGHTNYGVNNNSVGVVNILGNVVGGTGTNSHGVNNNSSGVVSVFGDVSGSNNGHGLYSPNENGILSVVGNVYGGAGRAGISGNVQTTFIAITGNIYGGLGNNVHGIQMPYKSIVTVVGDVYGGSGGSAAGIFLNNATTGYLPMTAVIIGDVYGGTGSNSPGVNSNISGNLGLNTVTIVGDIRGATGVGLSMATGVAFVSGNLFGGIASGATFNSSSSAIGIIVGNVFGGVTTNSWGMDVLNNTNVTLFGSCYGGTASGSNGISVRGSTNCTLVVNGSAYAGAGNSSCGILIGTGIGNVVVYGSAVGHGLGGNNTGVWNSGTGTLVVSGNAIGGNFGSTGAGAVNNNTGTLIVKRAVGNDWGPGYTQAVSEGYGVWSSVQNAQTFIEELQCGSKGQWPTRGPIYFIPNEKATSTFKTDTLQNYSLIQSNSADNLLPTVSSVRQGEIYDLGMDTGTCIIPPASSVGFGVSVDNTTGTATLTPTNVWNISSQEITNSQSLGGRLKNTLTANAAEKIINSLNFS
jgi:hypothetical protein